MKLKALPKSRAKTAWGLMLEVKRAVLEEPKRVNMHTFHGEWLPTDGGPACGTVGCIAGWVNILAGKPGGDDQEARKVLGIDDVDYYLPRITKARYSFDAPEFSVFNSGSGDECAETEPGTKAHARAVANRIDRFMKLNEKALKARKIQAQK